MIFLSLGAGVQSSTVLLMSIRGELPRIDHAIFADTGWEPEAVYKHLAWLKVEAARAGIPIHEVAKGNIRDDALRSKVRGKAADGTRLASMPYYTDAKTGDGEAMIRRQCTTEYKIELLQKKMRGLLGYKPRQRIPAGACEVWKGISLDEKHRATVSRDKWIDFHYPLIIDKRMNRYDCLRWLAEKYPSREVPRSACLGCPYHDNDEWRNIRDNSPKEWQEVVRFDKAIRQMDGMNGKVYLHRSRKPLDEVDLETAEEAGQETMFGAECAGMCGL